MKELYHTFSKNDTILSADIRYHKKISSNEKILFSEIQMLSRKSGSCFAGIKYFSKVFGTDERTIKRWIANLKKEGLIKTDFDNTKKTFSIDINSQKLGTKMSPRWWVAGTKMSPLTPIIYIIYYKYNIYARKSSKKISKKEKTDLEISKKFKNLPMLKSDIWSDFISHRKSIKKPLSELAAKKILNRLGEFVQDGANPNEILENSIINGWAGVFYQQKGSIGAKNNVGRKMTKQAESEYIAKSVVNGGFSFARAFEHGISDKVDGRSVGIKNENGKTFFYFKD